MQVDWPEPTAQVKVDPVLHLSQALGIKYHRIRETFKSRFSELHKGSTSLQGGLTSRGNFLFVITYLYSTGGGRILHSKGLPLPLPVS